MEEFPELEAESGVQVARPGELEIVLIRTTIESKLLQQKPKTEKE